MKRLRILLSLTAVVLAVSVTFAMRPGGSMTGFEYIPASGGTPEQCIERTVDCIPQGANDCELNTHEVRDSNLVTHCGATLSKP